MSPQNLAKHFSCRSRATVGYVIEPLTNGLAYVGAGGNVEQALIGFCALDNGLSLALDGEHDGALALFERFHEIAGPTSKGRERLDVFGDVEHWNVTIIGTPF
jgi:hypothetical protein